MHWRYLVGLLARKEILEYEVNFGGYKRDVTDLVAQAVTRDGNVPQERPSPWLGTIK